MLPAASVEALAGQPVFAAVRRSGRALPEPSAEALAEQPVFETEELRSEQEIPAAPAEARAEESLPQLLERKKKKREWTICICD